MSSEPLVGLRRWAVTFALAAVGGAGALTGTQEVLKQQAKAARSVIPKPTSRPFDGDGLYRPGTTIPLPWRPGRRADLHMMVFGDSLAAGFGAEGPGQLPGVLLARGLAEESGRTVRLSIKAIVGATSKGLEGQIEAMQIAGGVPDISVILIGGNDVTSRNGIGASARRLGEAVAMLRHSGSHVVVGTCPDLGTIKPVPQPLRSVLHALSVRLAAAQRQQVIKAGGRAVSLAETLAPEFHANPEALFSSDRFHPNSAGYELAAGLLLPQICEVLGVWTVQPDVATEVPENEPEQVVDVVAVPGRADLSVSVVARLSRRLMEFVRNHEDAGGECPGEGLHNEVVDSADTRDARAAADTLRRRSRILPRADRG